MPSARAVKLPRSWAALRAPVLALAFTGAAFLIWDLSGLDPALTRWFGSEQGFAWRDHGLTRHVLHDASRWLAGILALLLLADAWRPILPGPTRLQRFFWLGALVSAWIVVPLHKRVSLTSCPWDLAEFGGRASLVSHWAWGVADGGPGKCFPSGHATTAFGFLALYFLWRSWRPALARRILIVTLAAGALLAVGQLARGAHHLSHSLWSAWLCGAWMLLLSLFEPSAARARPHAALTPATAALRPARASNNRRR
ncbi:MAG: phosphatase PAP2 family protein [Rubrivivax sp.]|nr:phosphatase PAP2 family protein [Rubrivivax sp.]